MHDELLASTLKRILSKETMAYLSQYESPTNAWHLTDDPTWMLQLCDAPEVQQQYKQRLVGLGCRIIEETPISTTKRVYHLIQNKPVEHLFQKLRQYADGEISRRQVVASGVITKVENAILTYEECYRENRARLEVIHAVLALSERDSWMIRFYARVIYAVKAANHPLDYLSYQQANRSIADTIRLVFHELPIAMPVSAPASTLTSKDSEYPVL